MSWDGKKLHFATKNDLQDYMQRRLLDDGSTMPPVYADRGVSPEDSLIQYYRYGELSKEQKKWFWDAWREVSQKALNDKNLDTFGNAMGLADALPAPENSEAITDFLPKSVQQFECNNHQDHPFQEMILRLSADWEIIQQGDSFWHQMLAKYAQYICSSEADFEELTDLPPLIAAYNPIGLLEMEDWYWLLSARNAKNTKIMENEFSAIWQDQEYFCREDDDCLNDVADALAEAYAKKTTSAVDQPLRLDNAGFAGDFLPNYGNPKKIALGETLHA